MDLLSDWTETTDCRNQRGALHAAGCRAVIGLIIVCGTPLRSLKEIADEILALERKSEGLLNEVLGL